MNFFDLSIFHFLNSFAHRSYLLDNFILRVSETRLTTGAFIVALFWAAWEVEGKSNPEKREILLFGLFTSVLSVLVARVLALMLPFRDRPLHTPDIGYRLPYGMQPDSLINWSSFPSDHATMFICLAITLWMVSRRLGALAFVYVLFVIDLPRIYDGIHYPTDILAGTLLGFAVALLVRLPKLRSEVVNPFLRLKESYPLLFHCCFFLFAFEVGELFNTLRDFGSYAVHAAHIASRFTQ